MKKKLKKILKIIGMTLIVLIIATITSCIGNVLNEVCPIGSLIISIALAVYLAYILIE